VEVKSLGKEDIQTSKAFYHIQDENANTAYIRLSSTTKVQEIGD